VRTQRGIEEPGNIAEQIVEPQGPQHLFRHAEAPPVVTQDTKSLPERRDYRIPKLAAGVWKRKAEAAGRRKR